MTVVASRLIGFEKGPHGAMKTGLWASADYLPPQSHPNPSWPLGFWTGKPQIVSDGRGSYRVRSDRVKASPLLPPVGLALGRGLMVR